MKGDEAHDVLGMLKAATTQFSLDDETVAFWLAALHPLDAEIATKAVLKGGWKRFPAWGDYKDLYNALRRNVEVYQRQERAVTEGRHGYSTPEWVWVWSWSRFYRDPREGRTFPQQQDHGDPFNLMTTEEYQALKDEWVEAGSPKENPLNTARTKIGEEIKT